MKMTYLVLSLLSSLAFSETLNDLHTLTPEEQNEIEQRLELFYAPDQPREAMKAVAPKFSVATGERVSTNPKTKIKKNDPKVRLEYCEKVLKKHFPKMKCGNEPLTWETVGSEDRVAELAETWVPDVQMDLDRVPYEGKSNLPLWSDDYWRIKFGLTSYRYSGYRESHESTKYPQMIALYSQPSDFLSLLKLPKAETEMRMVEYSPAEKYDLTVGDYQFTLTNEQKEEGKSNLGENGDVEEWMGICHGWAPVSFMVDRPLKVVDVKGAKGERIVWYPADLKALLTLQWANGNYENNFVGGRCGDKKPETYPNGRLKNPECFDNNPATFHLALGNIVGRVKGSFVMDKAFDYEVWNQPIVSYEFTYFNPLSPSQRSKDWNKVAVNYDETFKRQDRFQKPLTRGKNVGKVVGVIATVVYVGEVSPPKHSPNPERDVLLRMSITYDLELERKGNRYEVTGGEWHENAHPDFLWVPQRETFASMKFDKTVLNYNGVANAQTASTAQRASNEAYPLCQVLKHLVDRSTGTSSVQCIK